jgi:copper resistance protein B
MWARDAAVLVAALLSLASPRIAGAEGSALPTTSGRDDHRRSAREHVDSPEVLPETPALPEGQSLEDVLDRAAQTPPDHFPAPVPDDALRHFFLIEQLEYRLSTDGGADELGWEGQGWVGFDYDKLWVKVEGESVFDGPDEGESSTDLLYSRLITPFWNLQAGVQYANGWGDGYDDRWSAVLALQGLSPGMVELDSSLYVSEDGDVTVEIEGEYDVRLTQRWVLQPRVELGFSAQDVAERNLGAGMTDANVDLRLRYEVRREIAPYVGVRYRALVGETGNRAKAMGLDDDAVFGFAGLRLAF